MVCLTRPAHNSRTNSRRIIKIGSKVAHDMSNIAAMLLHPGGGIPWWPNPAATPLVLILPHLGGHKSNCLWWNVSCFSSNSKTRIITTDSCFYTRRVWRSIQQNKRLRFIGFGRYTYPGAGGQFESENISGYVARRVTKISGIVAGIEPGPWAAALRNLSRGIWGGRGEVEILTPNISPVGVSGDPKIFFLVGPEGACLSSKHGVPPVTGRGRGIFLRNFCKKLARKRGEVVCQNCYPEHWSGPQQPARCVYSIAHAPPLSTCGPKDTSSSSSSCCSRDISRILGHCPLPPSRTLAYDSTAVTASARSATCCRHVWYLGGTVFSFFFSRQCVVGLLIINTVINYGPPNECSGDGLHVGYATPINKQLTITIILSVMH